MLNWETRYIKVVEFLNDKLDNGTILEIGSGPVGVSKYINASVVGLEYNKNVESESPNLHIEYGDVRFLNYSDNDFDFVLCSDVLEHLNPQDRTKAISECIRVANKYVLFQCPTGFPAYEADKFLKESFDKIKWISPDWLDEHIINGFPNSSIILSSIYNNGFRPAVFVNEFVLQHYSSILLDIFYAGTDAFSKINIAKNGRCAQPSLESDVPYSLLFIVDKSMAHNFNSPKIPNSIYNLQDASNLTVTIYSVFDRYFDIVNKFINIKPFFVKPLDLKFNLSQLAEPRGVLEHSNERASELTAISNILRNNELGDISGFCHYRRYLNLEYSDFTNDVINVNSTDIDKFIPKIDNPVLVRKLLSNFHLLLASPITLDNTIENHYCINHYARDYYNLLNHISIVYPYLLPYFFESMDSNYLYGSNLIIARTPLLRFIFDIVLESLEAVSKVNQVENRTAYQTRDLAFLSERIFDVIIRYLISNGIKTKIMQRIHVQF